MSKIILPKRILLFSFMFSSILTFSQTIVNYQSWTTADGCNIFSTPTNVPATINSINGNVLHETIIGQPQYDNINKSVNLVSRIVNGSQNHGTEYVLKSDFKIGYSYKITINAARVVSSPILRLPKVRVSNESVCYH